MKENKNPLEENIEESLKVHKISKNANQQIKNNEMDSLGLRIFFIKDETHIKGLYGTQQKTKRRQFSTKIQ